MIYEELLALARACADEGRTLETVTGRRFTVGVYLDCPFFTPETSGLGRSDGRKATERFLERYNQTGSLRTSDYAGLTRNASYLLVLVSQAPPDAPRASARPAPRRRSDARSRP